MHLTRPFLFLIISVYGAVAVPLLLSMTRSIKLFEGSDSTNMTTLVPNANQATALDYHLARDELYFSNGLSQICRGRLTPNGEVDPFVIVEVKTCDGLAVDWIHDNLYWTDVLGQTVEVATLDGLYRKVLFNARDGLEKPRAIVVDPAKRILFWTDWGKYARVESSGLDGKQKKTVVSSDLYWPNGLALDLQRSIIYILDGYASTISSCNYDGSNLNVLKRSQENIQNAFGFTFYANRIYWGSWRARSLFSMNALTGSGETIIFKQPEPMSIIDRMMGLKAVHFSLHQKKTSLLDPCATAGCSHRCLLGRHLTTTCICPFGFELSGDGQTCDEEGYLLVSWRRTIRRYNLNANTEEPLIDDAKAAISIAYHLKKDLVFWSDIEEHRIYRAPLGQLNNKTVIASPETCEGLAVDWVHDVLYWTDTEGNTLEAAQLDGSKHMVIFSTDLDQPRDIAVDPFSGLIFWTDWGEHPKIERATLDGLERKVIVDSDIGWPNGITLDINSKSIYWVDGKIGTISSSSYDGSEKKALSKPPIPINLHLFSITVFKNQLYWTDWESRGLFRSQKNEITQTYRLANSSIIFLRPNGVRVVHSSLQRPMDNPCAAVRCQNLCLGTTSHQANCMGEDKFDVGNDIENVIVYKKTKSEVFFRVEVANGIIQNLEKFVGMFSSEESNSAQQFELEAVPCVAWPESYCLQVSSLKRNTAYNFSISAALKQGTVGNPFTVSAITKEEASGPPEDIQGFQSSATSLIILWHHPNQSNGIIKSFNIYIDETETFEENKCCQTFHAIETIASSEESLYEIEITELTPASTYTISIAARNKYMGTAATIVVSTPPPPMALLKKPNVQVITSVPLSWQSIDKDYDMPQYHPLIRSYMLILLPSGTEALNNTANYNLGPLKELVESTFVDDVVVLWHKKVEETEAFQSPIRVDSLTAGEPYQLAWVQVAQYNDAYSADYILSDHFEAV